MRRSSLTPRRLLAGSGAALAVFAVVVVALAPGAAASGHSGCRQVVVRVGNRTFVGDRFSVYQRVGCTRARAIVKSFLRQGHGVGACTRGCRVGYRWLCYYEGFKSRNAYSHDCFSYPQYPAVGLGVHPGPGFFFYERT